jgi:hypothetical protein
MGQVLRGAAHTHMRKGINRGGCLLGGNHTARTRYLFGWKFSGEEDEEMRDRGRGGMRQGRILRVRRD